MKKMFFYIIFLLGICLNSCITYIEKDLDMESKLVLFSYLVPQLDTTIVCLTNSVPLFSTDIKKPKYINNATVEISENNMDWVKLAFDKLYQQYFITQTLFPIIEGKTYYIRASAPGFETVSASCTVPFLRETNLNLVIEESINDVHNGEIYSWYHKHYYFEWKDYPAEDNYYIFCRNGFWWDYVYDYDGGDDWYLNPVDSTLYHFWRTFQDAKDKPCIFSDQGQDGKKMSVLISLWQTDFSKVALLQTDRNCYLFERSSYEYDSDLQSFMLEPVQLYSNVKNGYGVFGAFVKKDYEFEVEE
jgi:hypothetical protein